MMSRLFRHGLLVLLLSGAACTEALEDPPEPPLPVKARAAMECRGLEPGPSPIRRLTRFEYDNTVRDLLGDTSSPGLAFVPDYRAFGFDDQALALDVSELQVEQYMNAAEHLAADAASHLERLVRCKPEKGGDAACTEAFIADFGKRAFRRPLERSEQADLEALFESTRARDGSSKGIEVVIQALLQSPSFLYRIEIGTGTPVESDIVALSSYEVASRLSYFLWSSMPDDELLAAADRGELATPEQVAHQARRLLRDPRARAAVAYFHEQWLELSNIEILSKSAAAYPSYRDGLRDLWRRETLSFVDHVIFDGEGDLEALLTAPYSMMNHELAVFYGLPAGPRGAELEKTPLDPRRRAGLLTQASVLAVHARADQSSPVLRGKFVRERLLCGILAPPPPDVKIVPPSVQPGVTTRERYSAHEEDPYCASCHLLMDPTGLAFEHYDAIGRFRSTEEGHAIDATGSVIGSDVTGKVDGAIELAAALAASPEVHRCVVKQWFRFAYGRMEETVDACSLDQVEDDFEASGYDIQALLVALTQTPAFRYRHAAAARGGSR